MKNKVIHTLLEIINYFFYKKVYEAINIYTRDKVAIKEINLEKNQGM